MSGSIYKELNVLDVAQRLKNLELFYRFNHRELSQMAGEAALKSFSNKESLYKNGDRQKAIYLVLTGSVRLQNDLPSQEQKVLAFLGRGEILGIEALWASSGRTAHTAISNEDVSTLEIPIEIFRKRFLTVSAIHEEVLRQLNNRLLELQQDICISHCLTPYRVAQFLLNLLKQQPAALGGRIQIPLSRTHIAQKIGSQSETVTRILSEWTRQGLITTAENHIEILDRSQLAAIRSHRPPKK